MEDAALKVGFVTCVQLGLSCMERVYAAGGRLQLAVTLNDDQAIAKSGRVFLDDFCSARSIPLLKTRHVNDRVVAERIRECDLDWLFIVGWSQIAGDRILGAPRHGVLGMHPTLLPIGRGRAAIPWAILKGLRQTGVTLFRLDSGVDTGPILASEVVDVARRETATSLYARLSDAHGNLIERCWPKLIRNQLELEPQDESKATLWPERKPEDGRLRATMSTSEAEVLIRAVTLPYPGAFMDVSDERLRVWRSGTPCEDLGGSEPSLGVLRLQFRDGWLDCPSWNAEPLTNYQHISVD